MNTKSKIATVALALSAMLDQPINLDDKPRPFQKTPLSKKQQKRRAKSKMAKQSRKRNRHL